MMRMMQVIQEALSQTVRVIIVRLARRGGLAARLARRMGLMLPLSEVVRSQLADGVQGTQIAELFGPGWVDLLDGSPDVLQEA